MLVLVCGLPGTGKSETSKFLAKKLNGIHLNTDIIRKEIFKDAEIETVLKSKEPLKYNLEKTFNKLKKIPLKYQKLIWKQKEMVYEKLFEKLKNFLKENKNVVIDGTFYKKDLRDKIYKIANSANTEVYLIQCICSVNIVKKRLEERGFNSISNANKIEIYNKIKRIYETPEKDGKPLFIYHTEKQKIIEKNAHGKHKDLILNSLKEFVYMVKNNQISFATN